MMTTDMEQRAAAGIVRRLAKGMLPALVTALLGAPVVGHAEDKPAAVRIGYVDLVNAQLVAKGLHLSEKQLGVPVTWVKFGSGGDLNRAVAAGQIDFGGVGNPPATIGITRGLPYKGIFVLDVLGPVESLIARPEITSIQALKGKTIATPFGSTSHYELIAALTGAGLKPTDTKILDMDPADAFAAWARKNIDAAYIWEPVLGKMEQSGGKILMDSGTMAKRGYPTWDVGVVMDDFGAKYPRLVSKYLKAECEAIEYWQKKPQETAALISKELNLPVDETAREMRGTYMVPCREQLTAAYLGTAAHKGKFVDTLVATATFLKDQNRLPAVKDRAVYADFIDPKFLEAAMAH